MFSLNNFPATEPHPAPRCKFPRAHHIWSGIQFLSSSGKSYCSGPYTIMRVLNIFLTIIHIWRENTLSGQSKKDCVLCWEVPQTIPRFDDSLWGLTGLSMCLYPQLRFIIICKGTMQNHKGKRCVGQSQERQAQASGVLAFGSHTGCAEFLLKLVWPHVWPCMWIDIYQEGLMAFSGGSDSKGAACDVANLDSIPGLGWSSEKGNGYPLQFSYLENPMDSGAWRVHEVTKSWTRLSS